MIRINLLPIEAEAAPTPLNPAIPVGAAVIVSLAIVSMIHTVQLKNYHQLNEKEEQIQAKIQEYTPVIAQVEGLQQAKTQLQNRKQVIQQLESERLRYPQFLDDFIKLLPGNLWLTNMTTTPQANTMSLAMDVTALDNYAIADLIANLESSQIFADVDLGPISAAQSTTGGQTMSFHLNSTYKKLNTITDATKKP